MSLRAELEHRSENACELCTSPTNLETYEVPPSSGSGVEKSVLICNVCSDQINHPATMDVHHWRCLNESMWSQIPAVQVMAWRMLKRLGSETWASDLLDMLYLDDDVLAWAQLSGEDEAEEDVVRHLDANGHQLAVGDTVTLIKDLNVKGAGFTAKRGTAVRNISLVPDNALHIEGRVNGQQIVILTEFVKK